MLARLAQEPSHHSRRARALRDLMNASRTLECSPSFVHELVHTAGTETTLSQSEQQQQQQQQRVVLQR